MEHSADLARVLDRSTQRTSGKALSQLIVLQANNLTRSAFARFLAPLYGSVHAHDSSAAAENVLAQSADKWTDLVIAERLANDVSGSRVAATWRTRYPQLRRVVLATGCDACPDDPTSMDAIFRKPFDVQELKQFLIG